MANSWRGAGLGSRMLRHLEDHARALGHALVRLDTNGALTEAISMYERAGYRATKVRPDPFLEFCLGWIDRNPVAMRKSASTNRRSSLIGVPRVAVTPRST